jgi:hypothetical protein
MPFVTNWGKSKRFSTKVAALNSDSTIASQQSKAPGATAAKPALDPKPYDFQSEFDYDIILFDWDSLNSSRNNASFLAQVETGFQFFANKSATIFCALFVR